MSMRGEIISREYNRMVFVQDNNRKQYVCYAKDVSEFKESEELNHDQLRRCLDTSLVLGDTW